MTWYHVSTSDLRRIGVAQAATTIFAAIGTFALSLYLDFSKDVSLAGGAAPAFLSRMADVAFYAWLAFWGLALVAYIWRRSEWSRIRKEHGELRWWERCFNRRKEAT